MTGREIFEKYNFLIVIFCRFIKLLPRKIRIIRFNRLRKRNGKIGIFLRYAYLKSLAKSCGSNVAVMTDVYIKNIDKISIGNNVSFHPMCYIDALGGIDIGNDVSIAHGVSIISFNHGYDDNKIPIKYQKIKCGRIIVHDNVWICARATILYNVIIGTGSIIGANSLVTHDVSDNTIVGGIPAKIIKKR